MLRFNQILSYLQRVTNQKYVAEIDGLRFIAIFPVVLMHLRTGYLRTSNFYDEALVSNSIFNNIILTGEIGVYIFFAISGFILSVPFAKYYLNGGKKIELSKYFLKRVTRLEPPYIITLFLFLLVHLFVNKESWNELSGHFFASMFYLHNIIYHKWSLINPVAWSLEIEIQFYILVPILTLIFKIKNISFRRILIIFIIVLLLTIQNTCILPYRLLLSYLQYFLLGFFVADIYLIKNNRAYKFDSGLAIDSLSIISLILIILFQFLDIVIFHPLFFFFVFYGAFYGNIFKKFVSNKMISTIGGMCYITYLIHYPLVYFVEKFLVKFESGYNFIFDLLIQYIIALPIIFIISSIAFIILERPFMYNDWPRRFITIVFNLFGKKIIKNE